MRSPSGSRKNEQARTFRLDEAILPPSAPVPPEAIDTVSMGLSTLTPSKVPLLHLPVNQSGAKQADQQWWISATTTGSVIR